MIEHPLTMPAATAEARRRFRFGTYRFTTHVEKRMNERRLDQLTVLAILRAGTCIDITPPQGTNDWTYTLATRDFSVVVAFEDEDGLALVTTWRN